MRLAWTEAAFGDLLRVRAYILQSGVAAARKTVACIEATAKNPTHFLQMAPEGDVPGTRELAIPRLPYFLVYRVHGDAVQILSVLHDKQKWPSSA
jgi:toxin ParE1/3/4